MNFICPVCGLPLEDRGKLFSCEKGHSYDKSKFSYVNLLMSNQSSSKRHGDDRLMIRARRDFLSKGYYSFLLEELIDVCGKYLGDESVLIDAGCGECYYSMGIAEKFGGYDIWGIDISKDALEFAHKRGVNFPLAVASLFSMPFESESADCIINCFSPAADEEYYRVLKKGGMLIRVVPLEEHLFSLKEAIYDKPYLNPSASAVSEYFETAECREIRKDILLENSEDILNLFKMTPYYYKTGREDQQKLECLTRFGTSAAFGIQIFQKA